MESGDCRIETERGLHQVFPTQSVQFDPLSHRRYDWCMQRAHVLCEQRKHPRAPLRLRARVRWQGPLGMRLEVTETVDVSREGVLLRSKEDLDAGMSRAWMVFPFDSAEIDAIEPETAARVVRIERVGDGTYRVGLQLETPHRAPAFPLVTERRASQRVALCLPIFVRLDGAPWPEETMTRDFSRAGVKFETSRIFRIGDAVRAKIPWGEWAEAGEISGRVARVETGERELLPAAHPARHTAIFSAVAVKWFGRKANLL